MKSKKRRTRRSAATGNINQYTKKERQRTYDLERNYIFFIFTKHIIHTQSISMNDGENGVRKEEEEEKNGNDKYFTPI